jgi:hypothetical protein
MFDARGRLIYVGKSVNLRERLCSYRHICPERHSRKLVRLVHSVERIEWEVCETGDAAKLRENLLLRERRPRYNSMNTWPKAHCFIGLRCSPERWEFSFTREVPTSPDHFYGAFKSGCLAGYASLLRLLWAALHQTTTPQNFPRALLGQKPPKEFAFELAAGHSNILGEWAILLRRFFEGQSFELGASLKANLPCFEATSLFQQNFFTNDLERLKAFFTRGPVRNADLHRKHALTQALIGQEALDDLLATS